MKIIDPHIHLFNLEQGDYHWLKAENPPFWSDKSIIAKTFTEQDLHLSNDNELAGFVHIEAGFDNLKPHREIAYLEKNCQIAFCSIAFIDLLLPKVQFNEQLNRLLNYKSVVGCRYIIDKQAQSILTNKNALINLAMLADNNLMFELQMPLGDLKAVTTLTRILRIFPSLKIIINHTGSPSDDKTSFTLWQSGLKQISQFKQCAIKCSGWEMNNRHYTLSSMKQFVQSCLHFFGEQRVMLASNFPVCTLSKNYQEYWQDQQQLMRILNLTEKQQHLLCYLNAKTWYQLPC